MSSPTTTYKIQIRRGTSVDWNAANPVLGSGEPGYETDTNKLKMGNGSTPWISLPYTVTFDSITLTGDSKATTPPVDDNDTSIATTAFVQGQGSSTNPLKNAVAAVPGISKRWAHGDHVHPSATDDNINASGVTVGKVWDGGWYGVQGPTVGPNADPAFLLKRIDGSTLLTYIMGRSGVVIRPDITQGSVADISITPTGYLDGGIVENLPIGNSNGWVATTAIVYRRSGWGTLRLITAKSSTPASGAVAQLPVGYRPMAEFWGTWGNSTLATRGGQLLSVDTTGSVQIRGNGPMPNASDIIYGCITFPLMPL